MPAGVLVGPRQIESRAPSNPLRTHKEKKEERELGWDWEGPYFYQESHFESSVLTTLGFTYHIMRAEAGRACSNFTCLVKTSEVLRYLFCKKVY